VVCCQLVHCQVVRAGLGVGVGLVALPHHGHCRWQQTERWQQALSRHCCTCRHAAILQLGLSEQERGLLQAQPSKGWCSLCSLLSSPGPCCTQAF
jgi:hypothetical protein